MQKNSNPEKFKLVTFRIEEELHHKFKTLSQEKSYNMTRLLKNFIKKFLKKNETKEQ